MKGPAKRRIRVSAGELAVVEEGEGPAVLFLHGFPTHAFLWRDLLPAFLPGARVIAPDLLGHGDSEQPLGADLGLREQTEAVLAVLEALGVDRCAVVAHAEGGGIAQRLAFEGLAEALVLFSPVAFDGWPAVPARDLRSPAAGDAAVDVCELLRTTFDVGMSRPERLPAEAFEEYVRPFSGPEGAATYLRAARAWDGRGLEDAEERLPEVEAPALIVWGEDDPFLPPSLGDRLADLLPGSTLALLPGCGHFLPEEARETVIPLVVEYLRVRYLKRAHHHAGAEGAVPIRLERGPPR